MKSKNCAICGHMPIIDFKSLEKENNRGYSGKYIYYIKCSNKECPLSREVPMFSENDIHRSKEDVYTYLYKTWDEENIKIAKLIKENCMSTKVLMVGSDNQPIRLEDMMK